MTNPESSYTIKQALRTRLTVKGSRFITSMAPANTEQDALNFISSIQEEFPDATHHTYAYRIGFGENQIERCSDAREPSGTAGPPMLQVLSRGKLTDVVVVATRYFGGTKLGIGGLTRAYRTCARACLEKARLVEIKRLSFYELMLPYDDLGPVIRYIESCDGEIVDVKYTEQVKIKFLVPDKAQQELVKGLGEVSRGQAKIAALNRER